MKLCRKYSACGSLYREARGLGLELVRFMRRRGHFGASARDSTHEVLYLGTSFWSGFGLSVVFAHRWVGRESAISLRQEDVPSSPSSNQHVVCKGSLSTVGLKQMGTPNFGAYLETGPWKAVQRQPPV